MKNIALALLAAVAFSGAAFADTGDSVDRAELYAIAGSHVQDRTGSIAGFPNAQWSSLGSAGPVAIVTEDNIRIVNYNLDRSN